MSPAASCIMCLAERISGQPNLPAATIARRWKEVCARHRDVALALEHQADGEVEWCAGAIIIPRSRMPQRVGDVVELREP